MNCLSGIYAKSSWHYCSVVNLLRGDRRIAWWGYDKSSWHYCSVVDLLQDKIKTELSWYTAKLSIAVP